MKITFTRSPATLADVKPYDDRYHTEFHGPILSVTLTPENYDKFTADFRAHSDICRAVAHDTVACIICDGRPTIYVRPTGYNNARYVGFVAPKDAAKTKNQKPK